MKRFSFSYKLEDPKSFIKKAVEFSSTKENFILLNSNDNSIEYDFIMAYGIQSCFKSSNDSLKNFDKYINQIKDWVFGYMSYDLKNEIESLRSNNEDVFNLPNMYFFQPKSIWYLKKNKLTALFVKKGSISKDWDKINSIKKINNKKHRSFKFKKRNSKEEYIEKIKGIKEKILIGDCYEMNFCFDIYNNNSSINPYETYIKLNDLTESPMSTFLKIDDFFLISSSPERYLKKTSNVVISQPIKGTAKRGVNLIDDNKIIKALLSNKKELSENHMIVDLVRNDLSRIAKKGSVKVSELSNLNTFKSIHQLISTIEAKIKPNKSISDVFKSTFPMGSMTGAPKIKSMHMIDEFETTKRGLYSGSVGYIKPDMDFDFNVVIRSIIYKESLKKTCINVGSAITYKSNPKNEFDECLLKAEPMIRSLK